MDTTALGDRMKRYERCGQQALMPRLPTFARLDGKAFHRLCGGLRRPFDGRFRDLMTELTFDLVGFSNALVGYTQSDEITLLWRQERFDSELFMGGRAFKLCSILAGRAALMFETLSRQILPAASGREALFDCRAWNVPTRDEAANVFVWRESDAVRNSILAVGQAHFSHKQLHGLTCDEIQELLFRQKGVNWNDFEPRLKRGVYVRRRKVCRRFTADEIESLPALHDARRNPDLVVERSEMAVLDMAPIRSVENRVAVLFDGEDPRVRQGQGLSAGALR